MDKSDKIIFYPYITTKRRRSKINIRLSYDEIEVIKARFPVSDSRCQITLKSVTNLSVTVNIVWNDEYSHRVIEEIERILQLNSSFGDKVIHFTIETRTLPVSKIRYSYNIVAEIKHMNTRTKSKVLDQIFDSCVYLISKSSCTVNIKRPKIKDNSYMITTIRTKDRCAHNFFISSLKCSDIVYIEPTVIRLIFTVYDSSYISMHNSDYEDKDIENITDRINIAANSQNVIILAILLKYNLVIRIRNPQRLTHDVVHRFVDSIPKDRRLHLVFKKMKM